ncbi:MAG: hypothetical protein LUH56_06260 [Oscillospiraceae bacterium]|nr:hypothetical protein [Oscillospiraceae bacterium]
MKKNLISDAITGINPTYVEQAADYKPTIHRIHPSRIIAGVVAAVILTVSVFATKEFLTASDVANRWGMTTLAEFFEDGGGEAFNIESQTSGGYTVSILGVATGDDLTRYSEDVDLTESYIVASIEREDGEPITNYLNITISPLFSGYDPEKVNVLTLGDGDWWFLIEDGIEYCLIETTNIGVFADHTIYIAVYDGDFPRTYSLNDDGTVSMSEDYSGLQTLFEIPMDESLADPEAAEALIAKIY